MFPQAYLRCSTKEEAEKVLDFYNNNKDKFYPSAEPFANRLEIELADFPMQVEDDPKAIFISMFEWGHVSTNSPYNKLKTKGMGPCKTLVSFGSCSNQSFTLATLSHCPHTGNEKQLIQDLINFYREQGINPLDIEFQIHGNWSKSDSEETSLDFRLIRATAPYSKKIINCSRLINTGAIILDLSHRKCFQLKINPSSSEYNRKSEVIWLSRNTEYLKITK